MNNYQYNTQDVCAGKIYFSLEEGKLYNVKFIGGCNGNLKAISRLVEGMEASRVIELLKGNTCGIKKTSCADQLCCALEKVLSKEAN